MEYTYILPNDVGLKTLHRTTQNSIIIIGANGAGKSRLGGWLEERNFGTYHRISGQRMLNFNENIPMRSEQSANNFLWYGDEDTTNKNGRWGRNTRTGKYLLTTTPLRDSDNVFSLVFAQKAAQDRAFREACKQAHQQGLPYPPVAEDIIEKIIGVWNTVFPHRQIILQDNRIYAAIPAKGGHYSGIEMSDGEKATLYLIAQCMAVAPKTNLIIDEPELHVHRSIMNKLWTELEKARPDCLFFYITHDTDFAASHRKSDKIWVKSFDGEKWEYELISDSELPAQLLLDILGNRKKVLFVEGTKDSLDIELYSELYSDYYVIPCGSCAKVIENVKAMRNTPQLNHLDCCGIVDRDFKSEREIEGLAKHEIFTLAVAEIENLFCTEGVMRIINEESGKTDDGAVVQSVMDIKRMFEDKKEDQIHRAAIQELRHQMSWIKSKNEAQGYIDRYAEIEQKLVKEFDAATDLNAILRLFNDKGLTEIICRNFGIDTPQTYREIVFNLLQGHRQEDIKNAMRPYLPVAI